MKSSHPGSAAASACSRISSSRRSSTCSSARVRVHGASCYTGFLRPAASVVAALVLASVAGVTAREGEMQTQRDADSMRGKLIEIVMRSEQSGPSRRQSVTITQNEVNGYLRYHATADLPEGVVAPHVTIVGNGRVSGRATVDLD